MEPPGKSVRKSCARPTRGVRARQRVSGGPDRRPLRRCPLAPDGHPSYSLALPMPAFVPDRARFLDLARQGRLCFVYREWLVDSETPVSVYAKLGRGPYSFLLESVV